MRNFGSDHEGGYSIIELLIVLVIAGILTTFAISQFGSSADNLKRQNITREFKVSLERARFDAVKRRANNCAEMARVEITGPTSYKLITDLDQNGSLDLATETRTINFADRSSVQMIVPAGVSLLNPIIIRFDQRGHTSSGPCGTETAVSTPTTFCNRPCDAGTANAANSNIIFVSTTGTSAMLRGGSALPTFDNPTVSVVDNNVQVNPLLAIWDAITSTPTPTPGGTPAPTPTPTPIPTPTPTPTPVPTPTPTPTTSPTPTPTPTSTPTPTPTPLAACTAGQRPAQDNCECRGTGFYMQGSRCRST